MTGRKPKDLTGKRFGQLVAVEMLDRSDHYGRWWRCLCDCGGEKEVQAYILNRGSVTSCGCTHHDGHIEALTTHGMTGTPTWNSWAAMKNRCHTKTSKDWRNYGERGIYVCDAWRDSFQAFLDDMGERPEGTTLDRIDVDRGYEPGNCRWADPIVQGNNRRANKRNRSGTPGVRWVATRSRWYVHHGKKYLGSFADKHDAVAAKLAHLEKVHSDQKKQDAGHRSAKMHDTYNRKLRVVEPAE